MDMLKRSRFDRLIEKATSELLIEPDIETTLAICDLIRGQELTAKNAVASIKRRLQNDNPNVVLHTLYVLESMMKNCGTPVHEEVATADFMSTLTSLTGKSYDVCEQVLACIQNWAFVFKGKAGYSAIQDAYEELKSEGHTFPAFSENDAMFSVVCAPNWKEEDICHRCKVPFTTFRRRHHCRNCGNSFCAECSSERAMLPKFGIEKEVRVCDHCFDSLSRGANQEKQAKEKASNAKEEEARREKERQDLELQAREQEELQLALALSASEAECKEKERRGYSQSTRPAADSSRQAENGPLHLLPVLDTSEMDPELARYLNRNYWENRANALNQTAGSGKSTQDGHPSPPMPQPSAPIYASPVPPPAPIQMPAVNAFVNNVKAGSMDTANHGATEGGNIQNNTAGVCLPGVPELTTQKQEEFLNALRASIEFFVNRMQSNSQRGRSIANDTTVQALFLTLHEMHPQLLQQKQAMEERRTYFEGLQDKLSQLREAREALDALRIDHAARRQMEEQEAARLRQLQMMQKLEIMRQQKRTTLEYKRRMALEQTMQYQQKYQLQHQPNMQSVDPVTGLPITIPMTTYQPANYPVAYPPPNIRPTEAGYAPGQMMTNYGPSPDLTSPYGQPPVSEDPAYYQPQLQQQQPPPAQPSQPIPGAQTTSGMYYNAQSMGQQPPIPSSYAASPAGPYSMQRLEAALPPTGTPSDIAGAYQMSDNNQLYSTSQAVAKPMETYSGQPNQPAVEIHPSSTGLPTQIAPAYPQQQQPPPQQQQAPSILNQQPQQPQPEQQAQSQHQPQGATEGQLISFD